MPGVQGRHLDGALDCFGERKVTSQTCHSYLKVTRVFGGKYCEENKSRFLLGSGPGSGSAVSIHTGFPRLDQQVWEMA